MSAPAPPRNDPPPKSQTQAAAAATTTTATAAATEAKKPKEIIYPVESYFGTGAFDKIQSRNKSNVEKAEKTHEEIESNKTTVAFKGVSMPGGKAGKALNQTYLMLPQMIPCRLTSAINSTLTGPIFCTTTQDVRSAGNAITPRGIPVQLNSNMMDSMGRAGIPGTVDNHYFERFGAGVLLALTQTAASTLAAAMQSQNNGSQTNFNFGGGVNTSSLDTVALEILRSQMQQKPTISVPPGTIVLIGVTYPIDFSDALQVVTR